MQWTKGYVSDGCLFTLCQNYHMQSIFNATVCVYAW